MATVFRTISVLASILVLTAAVIPTGAEDADRGCVAGEGGVAPPSPAGFSVRLPLLDFFIIQRALMTLPDEKAALVLERLRQQIVVQSSP